MKNLIETLTEMFGGIGAFVAAMGLVFVIATATGVWQLQVLSIILTAAVLAIRSAIYAYRTITAGIDS